MIKTKINLIPNIKNPSPDYYCTWQTQLYATSGGSPEAQRTVIGEKALFEREKPYGWAYFYKEARRDLIFVMDDSWDVPLSGDSSFFGSLLLNGEKFPQSVNDARNNADALKKLCERVKGLGWKGLGGWVCAKKHPEEYLIQRLTDAQTSGLSYWKVDWGEAGADTEYRRRLTRLGKSYAPNLIIEHAITADVIPHSDVFRTYDVPAVMSVPMTVEKLCALPKCAEGAAVINCEDEAYVAAAGGFSMGIMRHPYSGCYPNGRADPSFPQVHRDLKTKIYEVIRAARWHRIAPAYSIGIDPIVRDEQTLHDSWLFQNTDEEIEPWWLNMPDVRDHVKDGVLTRSAPAGIARGCKLPKVKPDAKGDVPYVIASKNPDGAFSLATLGRTKGREYRIPRCEVGINTENAELIGVFGEYESLTLNTAHPTVAQVLMQDAADDAAYDVTKEVNVENGVITIPGELIHRIGTMAQLGTDTSEPGAVIKLIN